MTSLYNKDATCPKCGVGDISARYCGDRFGGGHLFSEPKHVEDNEVIHRYCRNCGYQWNELPLDAKEGAK